ncbi:MAG TPA: zinc-dependent metalloprotease [Solirubrobacteraceae bacterium]|nr:zinc-dependent metalloprotease [Solirubrobacteraceae bacterium]
MRRVIDWTLATQVARGVARLQPAGDPAPFEVLAGPSEESERLVSAYTGLVPAAPLPVAEAVGRDEWVDANLASLKGVLDPVSDRLGDGLGPLGGIVGTGLGALLAAEAGAISGFLAGRVLGQYEFPVLDPAAPPRLLFVAPNLGHAAGTLQAEPDQLLRWVALHETTHALQFGAVPWLRGHLAGNVRELLAGLSFEGGSLLKIPDLADLKNFVDTVREDGIATLALGPERRELFDRMQALMAVLEGYAEHVMDAVGGDVLDDLDSMRVALDRRRRERSGFLRLFERLIGMDLKLRQYEQGKRFCDAVVARGGIEALNRAWASPEAMPSLAELDDPVAWLARMERPGLAA